MTDDSSPASPNFAIVTDPEQIAESQRRVQAQFRAASTWVGVRKLGSRGGSYETDVSWCEAQKIWYASPEVEFDRWPNGFGVVDPRPPSSLDIMIWINVAKTDQGRGEACFVRDAAGKVYLAHSGKLGGGKPGVGKRGFLGSLDGDFQQEVVEGQEVVILGSVDSEELVSNVARYVHAAATFKAGIGAGETSTVWKISPGGQADQWPQCRDGGYIGIGWAAIGDLTGVSRAQFDEKNAAAAARYPDWHSGQQLWEFLNIPVGAKIIANQGMRKVLGIGTVTGPYYYSSDETQVFRHRLPVDWDDLQERVVNQPGWRPTIRKVSPAAFEHILSAGPTAPPNPPKLPKKSTFEDLLGRMASERLHFSPDLVASYLLALQAKRFVILSGISGTGKTQLALTTAKAFQPIGISAPRETARLDSSEGLRLRVQPYMLKYHRLVVPSVLAERIAADLDSGRIRVCFGEGGSESLRWSSQSTATQLLFKGTFRTWFAQFEVGDELELRIEDEADATVLHIDRFKPSGNSAPASGEPTGEPTYELIAVRPDWTDNRGLLGYFNPITRDYQGTAFLRLLMRAVVDFEAAERGKRSPAPYFVILDEMNLARVEHYFSDFLSALESGEQLELHDNELVEQGGSGSGEAVPRRLAIPANLYFTGTVNVDETTYMFSPKVLDRAFVLEFNEVDLDGVGSERGRDAALSLDEFAGLAGLADRDNPRMAFRELLAGALQRAMVTLNDRLELDHRHFGYRVAKEIACFVVLASEQANDDSTTLWHAFDIAVLSKVLPKLHGTQQEIGGLLERLLAFAINPDSPADAHCKESERTYEKGRLVLDAKGAPPRLPRSAAKLWRMLRRVRLHGYVSFIE